MSLGRSESEILTCFSSPVMKLMGMRNNEERESDILKLPWSLVKCLLASRVGLFSGSVLLHLEI